MAQTVTYWQNKILDQIVADTTLSALNSPSKVAIYRLFAYVVAVCINLFEQTLDLFKTEVESIVNLSAPGTPQWTQNEVFKFQYSATSPQVVQLVDFVPAYATVDDTLKIITRCAVLTAPNRTVNIKVAKSDPPVALSAPELASLSGYLNDIGFAGIQYNAISLTSDKVYLDAEIFYNGQYSATISADVINSINTYLSELPFNGVIRIQSLTDAIQKTPGVIDVVINDLAMRADATAFGSKTYLVQNGDTILNKYQAFAGYAVEETTGGETFADKLTFTAE